MARIRLLGRKLEEVVQPERLYRRVVTLAGSAGWDKRFSLAVADVTVDNAASGYEQPTLLVVDHCGSDSLLSFFQELYRQSLAPQPRGEVACICA